jgi:inner membrane protein
MDTVTQMLLGATVAQAGFRRKLGRKALLAGAVMGLIPDLDVAVGWISGPFASWQYHRSFTHSLLFGPLVGPVLAWLIWRWQRRAHPPGSAEADQDMLRAWVWLCVLGLFTHPLIDAFTSYGTQLLWPLTDTRFAINSMPIIEPVYSLALIIAVVIGLVTRRRLRMAQDAAAVSLLFIVLYSLGGWALNSHIEGVARKQFGRAGEVTAYPMLFQPYYRRVLVMTPETAYVGYYSVLNPKPISFTEFPVASGPEVAAVRATYEGAVFEWFSMEKPLWRSSPLPDGTRLVEGYDLRYGMPGPSNLSMWGVRAKVSAESEIVGPVERISLPRDASGDQFRRFWHDMTGR